MLKEWPPVLQVASFPRIQAHMGTYYGPLEQVRRVNATQEDWLSIVVEFWIFSFRWLLYLSLVLFSCVSLSLSLYLSVVLLVCFLACLPLCSLLSLVSLSLYLSLCVSLHLSSLFFQSPSFISIPLYLASLFHLPFLWTSLHVSSSWAR